MTIILYDALGSPPCRAVLLTAKALNIKLNVKPIDVLTRENLEPEFVKINPLRTVPTMDDDGFIIAESRAIITYLVNKYAKGSSLYPEDPKARALVDQLLYFDIGTLYQRFSDYFYPIVFNHAPDDKEKRAKVEEALQMFNTLLEGKTYAAGPNLTLADLSLVAGVSSFESSDIDFKKYPNINRWYELVKTTAPGYQEVNEPGLNELKRVVNLLLKK